MVVLLLSKSVISSLGFVLVEVYAKTEIAKEKIVIEEEILFFS